ncbi:hypothetical protein HPB48_009249 [Haemaphysalis longicornis]|uniref:Uncharacterized protein n=1 Tax=Haemaphysalis longicornis TaxID=44386 RepID=A0A9J6GZB1_HAELO|nr:hypothetical protein HPB48_009249 [Haemaphysalis longicornis]
MKNLANAFCVVLGASKLLHFLRESAAYEQSTSYAPPVDSVCRKRRLSGAARRISALIIESTCYVLITKTYLRYLVQDYGERWRPLILIGTVISTLAFFVYGSMLTTILSRTSEVLADYLHQQVVAFFNVLAKAPQGERCNRAAHQIEEIRFNVSRIKGLIRSIDSIWHTAVVTSAACLIFLLCTTVYAVSADGLTHPSVKIVISLSAFSLIDFVDLAAVSQSLVDEVRLHFYILNVVTRQDSFFPVCVFSVGEGLQNTVSLLHKKAMQCPVYLSIKFQQIVKYSASDLSITLLGSI